MKDDPADVSRPTGTGHGLPSWRSWGLPSRLLQQSLALQFFAAGGLVTLVVMMGVGLVVGAQIKQSITERAGAWTALYVDSVIAPLLPDMQNGLELDESVRRALDETLDQGALGRRILSFRLWARDGTVIYADRSDMQGRRFEPNTKLRTAFSGKVVAKFDEVNDVESSRERSSGLPLLEVYNPVRQPWSGEVVAVTEFYEVASDLQAALRTAIFHTWVAVAVGTLGFFLVLSAIVVRGSRTIESQRSILRSRIKELSELLAQNRSLRAKVEEAARRTVTQNEQHMRRIGAELHDGPAQLIALAALELGATSKARSGAAQRRLSIRRHLDDAISQIRAISSGLIVPNIESDDFAGIVRRGVVEHERRTGTAVTVHLPQHSPPLTAAAKLCLYRVLQESLSNSTRHAPGAKQVVTAMSDDRYVMLKIADDGPGFDPTAVRDRGLGLTSIRERVESLGGEVNFASGETGTVVTARLELGGSQANA